MIALMRLEIRYGMETEVNNNKQFACRSGVHSLKRGKCAALASLPNGK